jgi:hypothetical protein
MATNTIALLARPPEIDPLEIPTKQANLRTLSLSNQEGALKLDAARQAVADDQSARASLQADPSGGEGYLKGLATAGNVKGYFSGLKATADAAKTKAETDKDKATAGKTELEAINLRTQRYRDALGNVSDQASAAAWVHGMYADPHLGPVIAQELGPVETALARIPDPAKDPQGFAAWKRGSQLGAEKLVEVTKPVVGSRALGDRVENTLTDPTTGAVTVTGTAKVGQSPDNAATQSTVRRGQDMQDARSAESNKTQLLVSGMTPDGKPAGDVEGLAQGIAAGKLPGLTGFALARPRGQAVMARVMEINPTYDAGDYLAKNQALRGFANGKEGTALRSFNVAQDHLGSLGELADQLGNTSAPAYNKLANFVATQTGNSAPTNFDAVKAIVAKEVVKAIVAGGGGVAEREELSHLLDNAKSPAQLKGVIGHYLDLMDAQKAGLLDQYERTTGRTDGEKTFAAKRHGGRPGEAPTGAPAATNAKGWALHQDAKGNKAYVSPDRSQFEEVH